MMSFKYIRFEQEDSVATLVLNRPSRNLLNLAMMEEINEALMSLREAGRTQVLVLRGADGNFSEGMDLKDHVPSRVRRLLQIYMRIFESIRLMEVISIAAVEGRAWGAGFELALGCNLIVAAETSSFALPEVAQGLLPPVAAAVLPRVAPRRRAMEWILTGGAIGARRLEQDGVINRLFPVDRFEDPLRAFIAEITSKSGPVLQLAKRAQYEGYYSSFPDALSNIQSLYLKELMSLHDAKEGPKAVREGREPTWQHG
jgi:enoyl-CoA hydratase/carnithine racemase